MARSTETTAKDTSQQATEPIEDQGPALVDAEVIEPVPGVDDAADAPMTDPTDLGLLGRTPDVPDLGVGDESALDDLANPGGATGSTLWDDISAGGSTPDPTGGIDGIGAGSGGLPFEDQTGWAMDGDAGEESGPPSEFDPTWLQNYVEESEQRQDSTGNDDPWGGQEEHTPSSGPTWNQDWIESGDIEDHDDGHTWGWGDEDDQVRLEQPGSPEPSEEGGHDQTPPPEDSTPIPDEVDYGSDGGELDGSIGGDIDGDPELEVAGGRGDLDGSIGADVDYDPELEDSGAAEAVDMVALGLGAVDPAGDDHDLDFDDAIGNLELEV
jgi:hypothetical protein